ncbi:hypothetical protein WA026_002531 [Henosepilachna vigintioctopunctata]|uniref:BolA-like protein 2 n=1 Tax=Henosepilachna vigintioctopunctata TaxID=420089 RepID=A0AAW1U0N0_9CUCU
MTTIVRYCIGVSKKVINQSACRSRNSRHFTVNMSNIVTEEGIKNKLIKELRATHVEVKDESDGCGGKFSCIVVADKFEGKPLLQRHRLVNNILIEELKSIHAFSQKTYTPDQWEELKEKEGK